MPPQQPDRHAIDSRPRYRICLSIGNNSVEAEVAACDVLPLIDRWFAAVTAQAEGGAQAAIDERARRLKAGNDGIESDIDNTETS